MMDIIPLRSSYYSASDFTSICYQNPFHQAHIINQIYCRLLKIFKMELLFDQKGVQIIKKLSYGFGAFAGLVGVCYILNKFHSFEDQNHQSKGQRELENKKPAGIYNQGNTCFVNSLLQALAPLKLFIKHLALLTEENVEKDNSQRLLSELKKTLLKINYQQGNVDVSDLLQIMGQFSELINLEQQDVYQLFSIIVDNLELLSRKKNFVSLNKSIRSFISDQNSQQSQINEQNCRLNRSLSLQYTRESQKKQEIQTENDNCLLGYTKSSFLCNGCHQQKNIKIHPFYNLSFEIAKRQIRTVVDALNNFQQMQLIEGWVCPKCSIIQHKKILQSVEKQILTKQPPHGKILIEVSSQIRKFLQSSQQSELQTEQINQKLLAMVRNFKHQYELIGEQNIFRDQVFMKIEGVQKNIVKQTIISKYPRILTIHLKQLSIHPLTGEPILLRKKLDYPLQFQIKVKKGVKRYQLASVISHTGNEEFGHYFTFRKMKTGTQSWFFISDTSSKQCTQRFMKAHVPYMLFYQLVQ